MAPGLLVMNAMAPPRGSQAGSNCAPGSVVNRRGTAFSANAGSLVTGGVAAGVRTGGAVGGVVAAGVTAGGAVGCAVAAGVTAGGAVG